MTTTTKPKPKMHTVVLINPIGRFTGVGKMTQKMAAVSQERAEFVCLYEARTKYYWCYHLKHNSPPMNEEAAKKELADMVTELNAKEPGPFSKVPLDTVNLKLAPIPSGVTYNGISYP